MTLKRSAYIVVAFATLCSTAWAHRINAFAWEEEGKVKVEVYFSSGAKAHGAQVKLFAADGTLIMTAQTDEQGECEFAAPSVGPFRIVAETADGHSAECELKLAGSFSDTGSGIERSPATPTAQNVQPQAFALELVAAIDRLERSVNALRQEVDSLRHSVGVKDAVAGVGFILGLTGVSAFFLARRNRPRR